MLYISSDTVASGNVEGDRLARQMTARSAAILLRRLFGRLKDDAPAFIQRWLLRAWRGLAGTGSGHSDASPPGKQAEQAAPSAQAAVPEGVSSDAPGALPDGMVVYAVGDVHGRADLLKALFAKIEADAASSGARPHIVMLGDYIDRGFQSRQVIDFLMSDKLSRFETTFLKGNHEAALLRFLEQAEHGPEWANYGGRETLVSYGVRPPRSLTMNDEWVAAHREFVERFPDSHLHFMRSLELSVRFGDYGFVHAGTRPGKAFDDQQEHDLLWIRDEFLNAGGRDDVVVVHGHTPADDAYSDMRRINVDTGAYFSGRLTAVRLETDQISFLKTR